MSWSSPAQPGLYYLISCFPIRWTEESLKSYVDLDIYFEIVVSDFEPGISKGFEFIAVLVKTELRHLSKHFCI